VCEPAENVSDIAISPDGRLVLASVKVGGYVAVLRFDGRDYVTAKRKISVSGQPYRILITSDGELGLVAGLGFGKGVDVDELSIIDLRGREPRTIDHVPLGTVPETIELSPNGRLLAAVVMDGSSLAPDDPLRTDKAHLIILERKGKTFVRRQRLDLPPVPSGAVFTGDGRYLVVQCHTDRELRIYAVHGSQVRDTGQRVRVLGNPSSIRAGSKP
jgi:DNA-binding beta-propeller fold protein YncE